MKLAIITDIHFDVRNGSKYFLDKYQEFFDNVFFPTLIEKEIKALLILGDIWEYRTKLNSISLHRAQRMFYDRLEELGIQTTMIYGNHDVAYKNTNEVNTVDFLGKMYPNIHVVKTCETIQFGSLPISFVSWVNNSNYEECLEFIKTCPPDMLCGHFEIVSFEMTKGHVCHHGFSKDKFDRFDRVISGHFHTISDDGRIIYISNPFQTNWSDYNLEKGFRILDTESREMEFVQNPFDVYAKIIYTDDLNLTDFHYDFYENKIVRVYVQSYAQANRNKLDLFIEKLSFKTYSCELIEIDDTVAVMDDGTYEFVDNRQLIETYINEVIQNDNIDKAMLFDMFNEMYSEALNLVETE